jgi:hypothetical protein
LLPKARQTAAVLAVIFVGASLSGCGLFDYEQQMLVAQERADSFDEENKYLESPVTLPQKKDEPAPNVFFRPPRGISSSPDPNGPPAPLIRYLRDATLAGRAADKAVISSVYLAVAPADQKDFASQVTGKLPELVDARTSRIKKEPLGREPLSFDAYESFTNGLFLYFCQRGDLQIAVGFQLEKGRSLDKDSPASKAIDNSLKSLGAGVEASRLKKAFSSRPRPKSNTPR